MRFVLGDDTNTPDAGVDTVGQGKVNNTELSAEIHRRLGTLIGQLLEAGTTSTGQHQSDRAAHEHMGLHGGLVGGISGVHRVAPKGVLVTLMSVLRWQATNSPAAALQHFPSVY